MRSLDEIRSLSDPLRQYAFQLEIPNVPGGGDGDSLSLRCTSSTLPGQGSEITTVNIGGHTQRYAGRIQFGGSFSAQIIESMSAEVYQTLLDWHALQWDIETGTQQTSDVYKTDGYMKLLDNENSESLVRRIEGMFIQNINDISVSADSSDPIRVDIVFAYDRVLPS